MLGSSWVGCSGKDRPPALDIDGGGSSSDSGTDGLAVDGGEDDCEGPPSPDTTAFCSNEVVPVVQEKPNLYFIVDLSGSMSEPIAAGALTKVSAAKQAMLSVVGDLGHRIRYGLATYPGPDGELAGCGAGEEVFETTEGDPIVCVNRDPDGPVLNDFTKVVIKLKAIGGTPLSGTLEAVSPKILGLPGKTIVVLMTDGAPNCNLDASCGADECMLNIEGAQVFSGRCEGDYNCCDPALQEETGVLDPQSWCVDTKASTDVLEELHDAGIETYVVGVPGSEAYADVMERLAAAGGTTRDGKVGYYDVKDVTELTDALRSIGSSLAQSCEIFLDQAPAFPDLFNVYFDATVVPQDDLDGWTLDGQLVTFRGESCADLRSGDVSQVQMLSGCRTVVK